MSIGVSRYVRGVVFVFVLGSAPALGQGTGRVDGAPPAAESLTPRPQISKPEHTKVDGARFRTDAICVKFRDGLSVRLRNGSLTDMGTGVLRGAEDVLGSVAAGRWERTHSPPEEVLDQLRQTAQYNLGRAVGDLNLKFNLFLPDGADPAATIDALNALDSVEIALPMPLPVPLPQPPDFEADQGYLDAATDGIDAECMWMLPGGTGAGVQIADLEYSWNLNHQDFPPVTVLLDPTADPPHDPFNDDNHGTAVLGEIAARDDGLGVTGIAHDSTIFVVPTNTNPGADPANDDWDIGAAIVLALTEWQPDPAGNVILIEQQMRGPNWTGIPQGTQFGLVPVEWWPWWYDEIVIAVGMGVTVVEAAGNGSQDLDDPVYSVDNWNHWPFLPANDSGAIIVGAGASPPPLGTDTDRSRLGFSNYGLTVDLQGWGENVYTTGYGDVHPGGTPPDPNLRDEWYTDTFSGTSSASPIVAGACALLQSAYMAANPGMALTPAEILAALQMTGSPQQNGTNPAWENIGPRPDAAAAICVAHPAIDRNGDWIPDLCQCGDGILQPGEQCENDMDCSPGTPCRNDCVCDDPIGRGIAYLRGRQVYLPGDPTHGSWSDDPAITAFAVLTMLNAGFNESDPAVDAGIQYILPWISGDGSVGDEDWRHTYRTSIAILPLVATHNIGYHDEITRMRNWLIDAQWDDNCLYGNVPPTDPHYGGFGYGSGIPRPDLSNTQFALMGLTVADWELGLDANTPDNTYGKAETFLDRCRNTTDGGSAYVPGDASIHTMTAASVWSYPMCGIGAGDSRVAGGINWLADRYTLSNPDPPAPGWGEQSDYYYRMTLAKALVMTRQPTLDGHDWYTELVDLLDAPPPARGGQLPDGSWPGPGWMPDDAGTELNTAWAIQAIEISQLPPGAALALAFILASHADFHVYDPEGRHVGWNYLTHALDEDIPGSTFQWVAGKQVVNLPQLVAGSYRVELLGTSNGSFELTANGIQNGQALPAHTWEGDITDGERLGTHVTITAMVGPLTPLYEDLVVLPTPPIPTLSEWGLIVLALLLMTAGKICFSRRRADQA